MDSNSVTPETLLRQKEDQKAVHQAMAELPVDLREVVVLRELEGLSYKEIAAIANIPMGTVMSRLARARERLQNRRAGRNCKHAHKAADLAPESYGQRRRRIPLWSGNTAGL